MFELSRVGHEGGGAARDARWIEETAAHVRGWLGEMPGAGEMVSHLPALELAPAVYVKIHDAGLLALARGALERISSDSDFERLDNATLAGLIGLSLRVFLLTGETASKDTARRVIEVAKARFDDKDGYFKVSSSDTSKRFEVRANALLGEVFYFAWRVLDDQTLRPMAGEILGQVSAFFDPSPRFSDREPAELVTSDSERHELGAIAAAMQLFMTAGETTARRSYLPRAAIVADTALTNLKTRLHEPTAMPEFARALLRLEQFTGNGRYGSAARYLASEVQTADDVDGAAVALAQMEAEHFPLHIVIVGDVENDENAKALWFAAMREYAAARVIEVLHPTQHAVRIAALGYGVSDAAAAHICVGALCLPAVHSVERLRDGVKRARSV